MPFNAFYPSGPGTELIPGNSMDTFIGETM